MIGKSSSKPGFALYRIDLGSAHFDLVGTRKIIPADEIEAALQRLASAIAQRHQQADKLILLGIANGGVPVCERVVELTAKALGQQPLSGVVNVSFHRDDVGRNPIPKMTHGTTIPDDLDDATVVLVDDVLFSGRTVRAAMEEVFANGRPARVELATLVDRGNRRLPITADYTGLTEETTRDERVSVSLDPNDPSSDSITISDPS